jgi:nitroreductase
MIELLRRRRSIRKYLEKSIEPEKVELLEEALLRAPSSRNIDPWEFVFVDERLLLEKLSACKPHGASFLKDAALGVVVCADGDASDVCVEDCSIASILVQMVAQSLGLGSCWVQVRQRDHDAQTTSEQYVQRLLGIPEHIKVESIIAIGYPAEQREPVPREQLKSSKVHVNRF